MNKSLNTLNKVIFGNSIQLPSFVCLISILLSLSLGTAFGQTLTLSSPVSGDNSSASGNGATQKNNYISYGTRGSFNLTSATNYSKWSEGCIAIDNTGATGFFNTNNARNFVARYDATNSLIIDGAIPTGSGYTSAGYSGIAISPNAEYVYSSYSIPGGDLIFGNGTNLTLLTQANTATGSVSALTCATFTGITAGMVVTGAGITNTNNAAPTVTVTTTPVSSTVSLTGGPINATSSTYAFSLPAYTNETVGSTNTLKMAATPTGIIPGMVVVLGGGITSAIGTPNVFVTAVSGTTITLNKTITATYGGYVFYSPAIHRNLWSPSTSSTISFNKYIGSTATTNSILSIPFIYSGDLVYMNDVSTASTSNRTNFNFSGYHFGMAFDASGNLFFADRDNDNIYKVSTLSYSVTSTATTGATTLTLSSVSGLANGMLVSGPYIPSHTYITNISSNTITLSNATSGGSITSTLGSIGFVTGVSTIAGTGASGSSNGTGTSASFNAPMGITFDYSGNLYVADGGNSKIRKISANNGVLSYNANTVSDFSTGYNTKVAHLSIDPNGNNLFVGYSGSASQIFRVPLSTGTKPGTSYFGTGTTLTYTGTWPAVSTAAASNTFSAGTVFSLPAPTGTYLRGSVAGNLSNNSFNTAILGASNVYTAYKTSATFTATVGSAVSLTAITPDVSGIALGAGATDNVNGMAVDPTTGAVYYSETTFNLLRKLVSSNNIIATTSGNWSSVLSSATSSNDAFINNSITVDANASIANVIVAFGQTLTINNGQTLTVSGNVVNNGTIVNNGTLTVSGAIYNNGLFTNGGTAAAIVNASGNIVNSALGTFTNGSGATPTGTINLSASIMNNGGVFTNTNSYGIINISTATATSATPLSPSAATWGGSINYTGSAAQTLVVGNYNNLTINTSTASQVVTLNGAATITGTLTLTKGILSLAGNNITINSGASISGGSSTTSWIYPATSGNLIINNVPVSATVFPVGSSTNYAPLTITPSASSLNYTVGLVGTPVPAAGSPNNVVNQQWSILASSATTATVVFGFNAGTGGIGLSFAPASPCEIGNTTNGTTYSVSQPFNNSNVPTSLGSNDYTLTTSGNITIPASGINAYTIGNSNSIAGSTTNWIGGTVGNLTNWSTAANWDNGVPSTSNTAVIPSTATYQPTISSSITAGSLTINSGATLTINSSGSLQLQGGSIINNGTVSCNSSSNVVTLAVSSAQQFSGTGSITNLTINNSNNVTILSGASQTVSGALTLTSGTLILTGNLTVNGSVTSGGGIISGASRLTYSSGIPVTYTSAITTGAELTPNSGSVGSLTINASSSTVTLSSAASVTSLALTAGTLADGGFTLTNTGNITGAGTHIGTGKITMTGSGASISGATLQSVTLNNSGGFVLSGSTTINGALTFTSGKLSIGANTLTIAGTLASMSAANSFTGGSSSVLNINGTGTLGNLYFDQTTAGTTNLLSSMTINRTSTGVVTLGTSSPFTTAALTLTAGTFNDGGNTITVTGNVSGTSGTIASSGSGELLMTGSGATIAALTLGNLEIQTSGSGVSNSGALILNGDLTVTSGTYQLGNNLTCNNINISSNGVLNSSFNQTSGNWSLFLGGSAGTANYTVNNNGTFGGSASTPTVADGIRLFYSLSSPIVTFTGSGTYNFGALIPNGSSNVAQTLNIQTSMNLRRGSSAVGFSVQNSNTFTVTKTCNIFAGVTLALMNGCNFHSASTAPNTNQGNIIYNIYGTLDLSGTGTGGTSSSGFNLFASTFAGNTQNVTVNVGDGTLANAGTLILGTNINMVQNAGQSVLINTTNYSTVSFGGTTTPVFTLTNAGVTSNSLFPNSFYNLTLNNTGGVTLPTAATVNGTLTLNSTAALTNGGSVTMASGSNIVYNKTNSSNALTAAPIFSGTVGVTYKGSAAITTGYELPTAAGVVNSLTINNSAGVTLGASLTTASNSVLTFTSGLLSLNTNSLTLGTGSTISGANSSKYILAGSSGNFTMNGVAANTATVFPIGFNYSSTNYYTPITITTNSGSSATNLTSNASYLTLGVGLSSKVVNVQWSVLASATVTAGIVYQFSSGNAAGSFVPSGACELGISNGTSYEIPATSVGTPSSVAGGYTLTASGLSIPSSGSNLYVLGNSGNVAAITSTTWIGGDGASPTSWTNANNWSGGNLPTSNIDAVIPSGLTYYPSISTTVSCNHLLLNGTGITNTGTLQVSSNATINGIISGTGTVLMNGVSTLSGTGSISNLQTATNTITLGSNFSVSSLNIASGTLAVGGFTLTNSGSISGSGSSTTTGSGKIKMTGAGSAISIATLGSLEIAPSSGTVSFNSSVTPTITGNLTLTSGTLADGGNTITVTGNISGNGTHTSSGSGELKIINSSSTISNAFFGNLEIALASGTITLTGATSVTGLILTGGTLADGGYKLTNSGSISGTSGKHTSTGSGEILMTGNGATIAALTLGNLEIQSGASGISNTGVLLLVGDLTVTSGTFQLGANLTCNNITITSNGVFNSSKSLSSTGDYSLFLGGSTGSANYTVNNNGIFGGSASTPTVGDGIRMFYSLSSPIVTFRGSGVYNFGALVPTGSGNVAQTLNIQTSMNLRRFSSGVGFSLQNSGTFTATKTCNISAGVTLALMNGCNFHTGTAIVPSTNEGNIIYNIYGTLDLSGTGTGGTTSSGFYLFTTTYSGNTQSVTVNVGDGTLANAGTLILGSNVGMVQNAGQSVSINANTYSTVSFGGTTAPNFTLTSAGTSTPSLFPSSFYNMTVNNTVGVSLPTAATVNGTLTLTKGILTTTSTNLLTLANTATSAISGGSATAFVNGPINWTLPSNLGASSTYNFPVGASSTYLPFSLVNPTTGSGSVTAKVQAYNTNVGISATVDNTLQSLSSSEYWQLTTSGNFTNTRASLNRPTDISPYDVIGTSNTATGAYTNLGGTAGTYAVTSSNATTIGRYFVFAKLPVAPDAPATDTAIADNGQVYVGYTAPLNDGGSAILDYTITAIPSTGSNIIRTGITSNPYTFNGLTNGKSYTFTVAARNIAGTGPALTTNAATPSATTIWNGTTWSAGAPDSSQIAIVSGNLTLDSSLKCSKLIVNTGVTFINNGTLTIVGNVPDTINGNIRGNGTVVMAGSTAQTILGNGTFNNLTLSNPVGVTIPSGSSLSITGVLNVQSGTLNTGGNVILKSTSITNSGILGPVGSGASISGKITVERYIPKGYRAFRDISANGVFDISNTLFNTWQESGVNNPGYGMFITGGAPDSTPSHISNGYNDENGIDRTLTGYSSAYYYANGWNTVTNTKTTTLNPFKSFRVLIRGDRNFNLDTTPIVMVTGPTVLAMQSATTLRATGTPILGDVTFRTTGITNAVTGATYNSAQFGLNTVDTGYTYLANPYACPIIFDSIYNNSSNIKASYYYLDPTIGSTGAWVSYNSLSGYSTNPKPSVALYGKYIQAGQGFLVGNNHSSSPVVVLKESFKSTGSNVRTAVFGTTTPKSAITISLLKNTSNVSMKMDGVVAVFSTQFSNGLGLEDNAKFNNATDNLSITEGGHIYSIDGRLPATTNDVLGINLGQLSGKDYSLVFDASAYTGNGLSPYLVDAYTKKTTALSLAIDTIVFAADTKMAATYQNRFSIVFKSTTLAVNSIVANAIANGNVATIKWNTVGENGVSNYEVEKSTDGTSFAKIGEEVAKNTATASYSATDKDVIANTTYYRIKVISSDGTIAYSNTVKLTTYHSPLTTIYPNPLTGKTLNVQLGNMVAGKYMVSIYNSLGQKVSKHAINHAGGNGTHSLNFESSIAKGVYNVVIRDVISKEEVYQSTLSIQ